MKNIWDDLVIPLLAAGALFVFLVASSRAAEFSVEFKPLKHDVLATEILWQTENLIDIKQTLKISREPQSYREVGTLSLFSGPHPTVRQVYLVSLLFGVGHYAVTQALTNQGWDTAARVWSYTSLGYKSWDINRNRQNGL